MKKIDAVKKLIEEIENNQEVNSNDLTGELEESPDYQKWELETEPHLERIEHNLLGERLIGGVWTEDGKKTRMMNERGASHFIQELRVRINVSMQLSTLDERRILLISANAGKNYSDNITEYWEEWGIEPKESNFRSICDQLVDSLIILLRISMNGGMRKHIERRGGKGYAEDLMKERIKQLGNLGFGG